MGYDSHRDMGRRRWAAVLFADLTGFTELVETVEPEVVYQVIHPVMSELIEIAGRYGGEIQQVLGDGFMCVFGLHETTGDECDRAIRAGQEMIATGGSAFARPPVHAGLEFGELLVTSSWPPAGYGVWGRAVNLASRLCGLAGPGELQVGPTAFAHTGNRLGPVLTGQHRLKGIVDPVVSHRIVAPVRAARPARAA